MNNIAIYGGSFNPPHVGHQLAVAYVLMSEPVDELWVMPAASHAFSKSLAPYAQRVDMLRLAMRHFGSRVHVCTLESELPLPSRTLHTLQAVRRARPEAALTLVVGADVLAESAHWLGWDEICAQARLLTLGRPGYQSDAPVTLPNVSSSTIRQRLAAGASVDGLIDREVLAYISAHALYR